MEGFFGMLKEILTPVWPRLWLAYAIGTVDNLTPPCLISDGHKHQVHKVSSKEELYIIILTQLFNLFWTNSSTSINYWNVVEGYKNGRCKWTWLDPFLNSRMVWKGPFGDEAFQKFHSRLESPSLGLFFRYLSKRSGTTWPLLITFHVKFHQLF